MIYICATKVKINANKNNSKKNIKLKMIALPVLMLDVEYCREAANDMCNQANRQESMAVLNPNHPQVKNDITAILPNRCYLLGGLSAGTKKGTK